MEKFVGSTSLRRVTESLIESFDSRLDGKSFKYLTSAQYEALSDEEKNRDDIVYQITDSRISYNDLDDKPYIPNIIILTQEEYDALDAAGQSDPDAYYLIKDEL